MTRLFHQDSFNMKTIKINSLFILLFGIYSINLHAQISKISKADKDYENYAYIDAIKTYERVAEKGFKDAEMFKKLGNAYYFNAELDKANKWYTALFEMTKEVEPEYYFRYSHSLKSVGKYGEANKMLDLFNTKSGNDLRAKLYEKNKEYLSTIEDYSGKYIVEILNINSAESDYGTSFYDNQIIFASSRKVIGKNQKMQQWTNQAFTSLYASAINSDSTFQEPRLFSKVIDSKFNEATPVFTSDGLTMYFTRNNYLDGKRKKDSKKVTLLKLYKATYKEGGFTDVVELPFNSNEYSAAHPALSPDEKTLYFVSDMPGSVGQSDLYKVAIHQDGTFGTPENLGNKINTEGKETFPFISSDNTLYFSSDGHPGLGGLDVFMAEMDDKGFREVTNIGTPINGPTDDFAYLFDTKTNTGFFTSNREGGMGYDDIYKFTEVVQLNQEQILSGIITDLKSGLVLNQSKVTLFDENMKFVETTFSDEEGAYSFDVVAGAQHYVRAEKENYNTEEKQFQISSESAKNILSFQLESIITQVKVGDDLAKVFHIELIYFDLDKSNIRPDAAADLAKIADVLKQNPTMKIAIRSHTDSRQTHQYNASLSERRAKATLKWLIKDGINSSRMTAKGFGETELVNNCSDGIECSEVQHQMNRRSEFIIIAL
ncbi:OmpA family protein [Flavobacterium antarcticum]|uniref:OmpA family protein n=1 Tax=Flavobacterium antarcticum TaxID=271155 RepID=UPI0003FD2CD3|nr:OmpA family protein [Flavobacterium antarcticum]